MNGSRRPQPAPQPQALTDRETSDVGAPTPGWGCCESAFVTKHTPFTHTRHAAVSHSRVSSCPDRLASNRSRARVPHARAFGCPYCMHVVCASPPLGSDGPQPRERVVGSSSCSRGGKREIDAMPRGASTSSPLTLILRHRIRVCPRDNLGKGSPRRRRRRTFCNDCTCVSRTRSSVASWSSRSGGSGGHRRIRS